MERSTLIHICCIFDEKASSNSSIMRSAAKIIIVIKINKINRNGNSEL
jgi:hypothetical protein